MEETRKVVPNALPTRTELPWFSVCMSTSAATGDSLQNSILMTIAEQNFPVRFNHFC